MQELPQSLAALAGFKQFLFYEVQPDPKRPGKTNKFPANAALQRIDAHSPEYWLSAEDVIRGLPMLPSNYGIGFVFTEQDPFFFFDIDDCLVNGEWSPIAMELMQRFNGACVEISHSQTGLHIIGTGKPSVPTAMRRKKDLTNKLFDLYTERRFVALTGFSCVGDVSFQVDQVQMDHVVATHLPRGASNLPSGGWSHEPVDAWCGPEDDDELIERALKSSSAASTFGSKASFKELWENDTTNFLALFPDDQGRGEYDLSRVDAALATHLAFWTGSNMERMKTLMWRSGLVRQKWYEETHSSYLRLTIEHAVDKQETFYNRPVVDNSLAEQFGGVKLRGSDAQREFGMSVRAEKLAQCLGVEEDMVTLCKIPTAKFWIENKDHTAQEILAKIKVTEAASAPLGDSAGPHVVSGYQFLGVDLQIKHFAGCVYVQDAHRVFTPQGAMLKPDQFNATYGGYEFQMSDSADKTTRKAWDAFTESQLIRYPKAEGVCFKPDMKAGELVEIDGQVLVNTYVEVETPSVEGDVTPFMDHLKKLLPIESDQQILLAYMAACVQHKGVKFQWSPLLQGVQGNGKTLFSRCVANAIGQRYTHMPRADEISEKFNSWLFDRLFIGVEDIYVPDHKKEILEVLKPMITNDRLACRAMQRDQVMRDVCANFILNSNHKNAIRKTRNDRRFAVFYTAQQNHSDLKRDGLNGEYFPTLYEWLKTGGYAHVTHFLKTYEIPAQYNPAGVHAHRAPDTSSTEQAIAESLGGVEQEILEAIEEERPGFAGGWISSVALDRLLQTLKLARAIPHNKRKELLNDLGYYHHPNLKRGRTNVTIALDGNKKPTLFTKKDALINNLDTPTKITQAYMDAQNGSSGSSGSAAEVFRKK